jgi:hypothetical protein
MHWERSLRGPKARVTRTEMRRPFPRPCEKARRIIPDLSICSNTCREPTSGLAKLESDDVLVLFAAAPGRTASDGSSANSPFAEALAKRLPEPGLAIQLLGGSVRDDVLGATGGNQRKPRCTVAAPPLAIYAERRTTPNRLRAWVFACCLQGSARRSPKLMSA